MSTIIEKRSEITAADLVSTAETGKLEKGGHRGWIQVGRTISFEFLRNGKKLLAMLLTSTGIFLLSLIIQLIQKDKGVELPTDPADYFLNYLTMIDLLILIIGTTFFGSIIAEDFEKETGNLLFPKIQKDRLLFGRFVARYIYAFLTVAFYYLLVAVATFIEYSGVPKIVWGSMLWAEWYLFGIAAFFTMFSSLFNRSATAMISGLLSVLIIFNLLSMIFMFTGVTAEPFYFLTYYSNIITKWFDMPAADARYQEFVFGRGPGAGAAGDDANTYYQWLTPSATGAVVGLAVYSLVCITIAYIMFRRKQK